MWMGRTRRSCQPNCPQVTQDLNRSSISLKENEAGIRELLKHPPSPTDATWDSLARDSGAEAYRSQLRRAVDLDAVGTLINLPGACPNGWDKEMSTRQPNL